MHDPSTAPEIERFLDRVRASLRGMRGDEVEEIVRELRSHIADRAESAKDLPAALRSLGDPEELARQYRTDRVVEHAECARSPIVVLHGLLLIRRESAWGWIVLALTLFGYAWAVALGTAAVEKILSPRDVGLWIAPGGSWIPLLTMEGPGLPGSRELLGWWIVPLGVLGCAALVYLSGRFGRWWIGRSRRARDVRAA